MAVEGGVPYLGVVKVGDEVKHKYKFTNVGDGDLIIEYVTNQCECTSNDDSWPRRPIKPGESVEMMVTFKPDEPGNRRSGVDIIANTDPIVFSLEFTADVIPK